jgi:hypothetical protein
MEMLKKQKYALINKQEKAKDLAFSNFMKKNQLLQL